MASLKVLAFALLMGATAMAQSAKGVVGSVWCWTHADRGGNQRLGYLHRSDGRGTAQGKGTVREGAQLYRSKGCAGCHGANAIDGKAPILKSKAPPNADVWARGRILPLRAPHATTVWDYINRGMPLNREGTLTPDEVYSLTVYLLFINDVIKEDEVLDATPYRR